MKIDAQDIKRMLLRTYKRYQQGNLTAEQAYKETFLLNGLLKAIELTDIEERLQLIENTLKDG